MIQKLHDQEHNQLEVQYLDNKHTVSSDLLEK